MKGIWVPVVFAASGIALVSCDPCSGVGTCDTGPRLSIEGTIVGHIGGLAAPNVRVDVVRTGGVPLERDSLSTVTDVAGHWSVAVPATAAGDVVVDINVQTPDFGDYRVPGVHVATTNRHGDGQVLPPWVVNPHFPYAVELHYRTVEDIRLVDVGVRFVRTGGVGMYVGSGEPEFAAPTDAAGRLVLFDIYAHANGVGDVVGDLIVMLPPPFVFDTIHNLHLRSTQLLQTGVQVLRFGAGPSLLYTAEFHERRNDQPAPGVRVTFRRTGGVRTVPETFTTTSDAGGRFFFPLRALAEGPVIGDLDVVPRLGGPFTTKNFTLKPHHDEESRFYGVLGVGPILPWVGLVQIDGRGVSGVVADVHRAGGIQAQPADYTTRSDANGFIRLNPQPQDTGFVDLDVTIHSPAPFRTFTSRVRIHTVEDDVTGGIIVGWDLDRQPAASGAKP